jgi:hypothetical protein
MDLIPTQVLVHISRYPYDSQPLDDVGISATEDHAPAPSALR